VWAGLAALGFGIVLVLMRVGGAGSYYDEEGSPEHWLTRAETELKQGAFQRALDSVQMAELRKPDADTKSRIESMREKIKSTMGRERDEVAITAARRGLGVMEEFEQLHLSASRPRPAVRELARNAQQWLQNYGDVMRRYPETSADVAKVKSMYDRFAPEAQLDRPDDSGDVLFKVERRLSLPVPLYSDALAAIDDYLRTHATDPKAQDLRDRRTQVVDKAKADFDRHETAARRFLSIRQFADARKEVMAMRNAIVVNAWAKVADALEKDIDSAAK
jgi:hypothetical protein